MLKYNDGGAVKFPVIGTILTKPNDQTQPVNVQPLKNAAFLKNTIDALLFVLLLKLLGKHCLLEMAMSLRDEPPL